MTADDLIAAVRALASCDHFDQSRRAARVIPDDIAIVDLLRAADGATRLAHDLDLDQLRRIAS